MCANDLLFSRLSQSPGRILPGDFYILTGKSRRISRKLQGPTGVSAETHIPTTVFPQGGIPVLPPGYLKNTDRRHLWLLNLTMMCLTPS